MLWCVLYLCLPFTARFRLFLVESRTFSKYKLMTLLVDYTITYWKGRREGEGGGRGRERGERGRGEGEGGKEGRERGEREEEKDILIAIYSVWSIAVCTHLYIDKLVYGPHP